MKAFIILVGTELLNGMMVDTNSVYMAEELNKYGVEIQSKISVGDDIDEIYRAIDYGKRIADLVIISGGLGPTIDDLTKDAIAKYTGRELLLHNEQFERMKEKFRDRDLSVQRLERNKRQVMLPEGSYVIDNGIGIAPSIYVDGIAAFPGVPSELFHLFPKFLDHYRTEQQLDSEIYIKDILVWGIPESFLEETIVDLFTEDGIFYEFLVKSYGIIVRLLTNSKNKEKVDAIKRSIYDRIGENIYGEDMQRLEKIVIEKLAEKNYTLSTAESCTGGLLSSFIIEVSGVSKVFKEGLVTYSNEAKVERLGVKRTTLEKFGAVSSETANEMLEGLKTDVGISVTGIAGPTGGTKEKPVGTVYIGIRIKDDYYVNLYKFKGDRNKIRTKTALTALFELQKLLNN